ncbi:hypothetical protein LNU06_00995 [Campylobacter sp. VicNov18]|uniref:hypothetical protein n=1 Tax=Campylobacter bilis TaxID=2691918 RepID=UPI001E29F14D|nr:hypothetical protein [Campylobacter bilis]MCC8349389.1 hypothetical protein [Campylobacter bilis]
MKKLSSKQQEKSNKIMIKGDYDTINNLVKKSPSTHWYQNKKIPFLKMKEIT